jgi:hypothetical protein
MLLRAPRRAGIRPEPAWRVRRWRRVMPQPADLVTLTRAGETDRSSGAVRADVLI